jgi:glycosyltransferase involved in cell wall biosynthesis
MRKKLMDPILTVMMPSYNYAKFLRQAIDTILNQSFSDFEFLIVEDGSTDESPEIIRAYMKQDPRIKAIFYPRNQGMLQCVNEGTALAKGKYIHYIAADDFRYPGFLQKCMNVLLKKPELGMCCTQFHYGNEEKLLLESCGFETDQGIAFFEPGQMVEAFFKKNLKIFALAAILKTGLVKCFGGFDSQLYYLSDWYLLNEISFNQPMALIKEPLSRFRIHDSNFSNVYRHNKKTKMAAYARLFEKLDLKENAFYKEQIRKSGIMGFIFQDLFWKLLFNPKYLTFWPYINPKYPIKQRLKKSLMKKLKLGHMLSNR